MQEKDRPTSLSMDKEPLGLPPVSGASEEAKVDPKYFGEGTCRPSYTPLAADG
jgi:hypothetical protein